MHTEQTPENSYGHLEEINIFILCKSQIILYPFSSFFILCKANENRKKLKITETLILFAIENLIIILRPVHFYDSINILLNFKKIHVYLGQ